MSAITAEITMLTRREWCYVQPPETYEIAPCSCGNIHTQWSEFEHHLWCATCEKDFIPEHNGIFDGPIGIGAAGLFGMSFDRIDLKTHKRDRFDPQTLLYETEAYVLHQKASVPYMSEILKMIEHGVNGNAQGVQSYAQLLAAKLRSDGMERHACMVEDRALQRKVPESEMVYSMAGPRYE